MRSIYYRVKSTKNQVADDGKKNKPVGVITKPPQLTLFISLAPSNHIFVLA